MCALSVSVSPYIGQSAASQTRPFSLRVSIPPLNPSLSVPESIPSVLHPCVCVPYPSVLTHYSTDIRLDEGLALGEVQIMASIEWAKYTQRGLTSSATSGPPGFSPTALLHSFVCQIQNHGRLQVPRGALQEEAVRCAAVPPARARMAVPPAGCHPPRRAPHPPGQGPPPRLQGQAGYAPYPIVYKLPHCPGVVELRREDGDVFV